MSALWLVQAPEQPTADAVWAWTLAGAGATGSVARGDLQELAASLVTARERKVVVLLPTSAVLTAPVTAPLRQQRQLQQALPFLLEENLAGNVEDCHVVAGMRLDAQRLQLVAVDRDLLRTLLDVLHSVGIDPAIVSSEALALALPERGVTILLDGEASLLATSEGQTLAFDQADALAVVSTLAINAGDAVRIVLGAHGDSVVARTVESELLMAEVPPQVLFEETPADRLTVFAVSVHNRLPVNLRQGSFAHVDATAFSLGFDWRPLAWLAASWAVLALGYQLAVGITHSRAAAAVQEAQVALYRQVFPGAKNVPHPRAQLEGQLRGVAGGGTSFTELVASTSEAIAAAGAGRYTPRSLAWDAAQGQLRIDIVAHSLEDLEQLRRDLEQRGLRVDIGSGVSQEGGYKARMNVGMNTRGGDA